MNQQRSPITDFRGVTPLADVIDVGMKIYRLRFAGILLRELRQIVEPLTVESIRKNWAKLTEDQKARAVLLKVEVIELINREKQHECSNGELAGSADLVAGDTSGDAPLPDGEGAQD